MTTNVGAILGSGFLAVVILAAIIVFFASLRMCSEWERKVVLRLGRRVADFGVKDATREQVVAAITGADIGRLVPEDEMNAGASS